MAFFVIFRSKINFFALGAYKMKFSGYAYDIEHSAEIQFLSPVLNYGPHQSDVSLVNLLLLFFFVCNVCVEA